MEERYNNFDRKWYTVRLKIYYYREVIMYLLLVIYYSFIKKWIILQLNDKNILFFNKDIINSYNILIYNFIYISK